MQTPAQRPDRAGRVIRRAAVGTLLGCTIVLLSMIPAAAQNRPDIDALNAEIDRELNAYDFDGAYETLKQLRAALAARPAPDTQELLRTEILLGSFAKAARRFDEADMHFARAQASAELVFDDPPNRGYHLAWAQQGRADNLIELGQFRRAARMASQALETRRETVPYDFAGMLRDALIAVRAFVELEQWDDAMRFLGWGFDLIPRMAVDRELSDINLFAVLLMQVTEELGHPDIAASYAEEEHFPLAASIKLEVPDSTRTQLSYYRTLALIDLGDAAAAIEEADRTLARPGLNENVSQRLIANLWHAKGLAEASAGDLDPASTSLAKADAMILALDGGADHIERLRILVDRLALTVRRGAPYDGFSALFNEIAERMRAEASRMALGRTDRHEVRLRQMRNLTRRTIDLMANAQAGLKDAQWLGNVVAFHLAQLARFGETGAAVSQMAARASAGDDRLARTVVNREAALDERSNAERELFDLASRVGADASDPQRQALRVKIERLDRRLASFDDDLARRFPSFSELVNPTIVDWMRIGESLQPYLNETLLFYFIGEENSLVWGFNGGGVGVRKIPEGRRELTEKVQRLRQSLEPRGISRVSDLQPYDFALAKELYDLLIRPARGTLFDERTRHLIIVPDGPLTGLPFEILVSGVPDTDPASPPSFDAYRKAGWLGTDVAISIAPTVSALVVLREAAGKSRAPLPFLGIGDPLLSDHPFTRDAKKAPETSPVPVRLRDDAGEWIITVQRSAGVLADALFRNGRGDVNALRKLPSLPETAEELTDIARSLDASTDALMLREHATEHDIRQRSDLDQYRIVAFATHGVTAGELDGASEPALVLTPPPAADETDDGLLTASEIADLQLDADWVILSACNTAAPDGTPGASALSGLARAFFHAGARTLLVSHWSVISDAASIYTREMLANLARDPTMARAEAARRAKLRVMNDPEKAFYAHPLFWAPFSVVGEGWARHFPLKDASSPDRAKKQ